MKVNAKPSGLAVSVPVGLAWGTLTALVMTLILCLGAAKLINEEILKWDHSGYAVLVIILLSSWAGAKVSAVKIKRQRMIICLASGLLYFLMLMAAAALFFGGRYSGVGETGLLIFCGSMLGVLTGFQGKTRRNAIKMKGYNR